MFAFLRLRTLVAVASPIVSAEIADTLCRNRISYTIRTMDLSHRGLLSFRLASCCRAKLQYTFLVDKDDLSAASRSIRNQI